MDLSKLEEHYELLKKRGYITNCPPYKELLIWHDKVNTYCNHLNQLALSDDDYEEDEPFECKHLNEPSGDYIAIFEKNSFRIQALQEIDIYAESQAGEYSRNWK